MKQEPQEIRTPWIWARVLAISLFMLACFGALGAKLYVEQVMRHRTWTAKVKKSSNVTVRLPSVRGEILDRHGIVLVNNRTSYGVDFYLPQIVQGYRKEHQNRVPKSVYRTKIGEMPEDVEVPDVVQILNSWVIPKLTSMEIARDYNAGQLERHFRTNEEVPFPYLDNVDFDTVAKISENDTALPGVVVALRPERQYIYGAFASHVLGYVGAPEDINKEPDIKEFNYYDPDVVGRASVEKYCDEFLRGTPGKRVLERTPKGRIGAEIERVEPKPGNHVYLTIDARIQMIVENTLRQAGVGRAAAVVVDPNNGDVLAMANVPDFDPNVFIPKISAESMQAFEDDETNPLLNRSIQGYLPGSTYKVVTAFAGLRAGLDPSRKFNCPGGIEYGGRLMKCWIAERGGSHGLLNLQDGLKNSCNCYFFQQANWIDPETNVRAFDQFDIVGEALGLGMKPGLPLSGESAGILPGPKWLKSKGLDDLANSRGQIANTSIGQGKVLASPLQIAMVCSTVANGGISYYPRLIHRVVDGNREDVRGPDGKLAVPLEPRIHSDLRDLGISSEGIEAVRRGMWKVVNEPGGTGSKARMKDVEVAAKTGTAQHKRKVGNELVKDNRVWFMCFAPYKKPKYVVVVMVEGAKSGGGVTGPLASKILRESLALERGVEPAIAALKPVSGNFERIEEIALKEDGSLTTVYAKTAGTVADTRPGDDEVSVPDQDLPVEGRANPNARPDVRAPADARGRVTPTEKKPNLWQRLFGPRQVQPPAPAANPGRIR